LAVAVLALDGIDGLGAHRGVLGFAIEAGVDGFVLGCDALVALVTSKLGALRRSLG
jgi:hypothetical protein